MPTPEIFTSVINSYLPEPHSSLLNGLIFGSKLNSHTLFYSQVKRVGLLHLVVLSGINITLLATIITSATFRLGRKISLMIALMAICGFILFVGAEPPIIRAGFMGVLAFSGVLLGRKSFSLYALFLSFIFILIFWPKWIGTISLQLSYAATLGITLFAKTTIGKSEKFLENFKEEILAELRTSICAQIFTMPIIFLYFREVSVIAPLSNLLVSWIIAPAMVFGFLTAILGKMNFFLGLAPSYVSYVLVGYIIFVIKTLSPFSWIFFKF